MYNADYFFSVFLTTLVLTRAFVYFKPLASPTIHHFRFHHYLYGICLVFLGLGLKNIIVYGVGFGLFVDEVPFLLIHGRNHSDNYSPKSLVGVLVCVLVVYMFRSHFAF